MPRFHRRVRDGDSHGSYVSSSPTQPANKSKEKEECVNKEQQCKISKKDVKLLCDIFFNKLSPLSRNTLWVLCLFVIIPLSHGSDDSVDQLTDCV